MDESLGLDLPMPGPLAKHADLPLLSVNLPAEFARLRVFLLA
ncbi:TPA: threonine synthase [Aeromonas dhakensis]|nr:threonine synthase [Aeromonas dhakensis]HDX8438495.1 threonine synthase [Aeromonas dhakensis]